MDTISFFVIVALIGAAGGIIYWYTKSVGGGTAAAAFEDAHDRNRVLIFSAVVIGVTLVLFFGLAFLKVIKL